MVVQVDQLLECLPLGDIFLLGSLERLVSADLLFDLFRSQFRLLIARYLKAERYVLVFQLWAPPFDMHLLIEKAQPRRLVRPGWIHKLNRACPAEHALHPSSNLLDRKLLFGTCYRIFHGVPAHGAFGEEIFIGESVHDEMG